MKTKKASIERMEGRIGGFVTEADGRPGFARYRWKIVFLVKFGVERRRV